MTHFERQGLILSMSELSQESQNFEQEYPYATRQQAFYDQSIFGFVVDEVHAMMQVFCCECRTCANFYNPLYILMFGLLYILTLPGAALHWMFLSCVPVRCREYPEEREFRSQGIYTAIGIALISIPFSIIGLFLGEDVMVMINKVAIVVNFCIVATNLIGLRAITDEMLVTTRVFIVGIWIVDFVLIGLALFDVYSFVTVSWETLLDFVLRIFEIFVYTVIGVQSIQFWDLYAESSSTGRRRDETKDWLHAVALALLELVVLAGFVYAVYIAEEKAWRIMYW
jgi:hypothetical protein